MEPFSSKIKKFQETETPKKKDPYISGNGNHKKASYILRNETFQSIPRKTSYTSGNKTPPKISYIFSEESFS